MPGVGASLAHSRVVSPGQTSVLCDVVQGSEPEVSAVRTALYRGDPQAALALVRAGADLNEFDLLLEAGADPAARNAEGRDAFAFAADNGHAEIAAGIEQSRTSAP